MLWSGNDFNNPTQVCLRTLAGSTLVRYWIWMKWDAGLIRPEMTLVWHTSILDTTHMPTTLQRPEVRSTLVFYSLDYVHPFLSPGSPLQSMLLQ